MPAAKRYLTNNLSLPPLDASTLHALQVAVRESIQILPGSRPTDYTLYTGLGGVVLMYIRLRIQAAALLPVQPAPISFDFRHAQPTRLDPSRVSPILGSIGVHTMSLLNTLISKEDPTDDLFRPLQAALSFSASPNVAHEVLYGNAGLLAALISAGRLGASHSITSSSTIQALAIHIIKQGRKGAADYAAVHGPGIPLMWAWKGKYYLGAMHGVAGILTILLQLPETIRDPMMDELVSATYALLGQVDAEGHLPSSLPRRYHSSGELVQLCHGAPGALLLIAALRTACAGTGRVHPPELDVIETRLSDRVWKEGLLSKGISLCHGITGNAWPWLLLSQSREEPEKREQYLRQALAFFLLATKLPPLGDMEGYGQSEQPFCLFTGLVGAVTAWTEACAILRNRLREEHPETSESSDTKPIEVLGVPWLGGLGCCGL